MKYGSYFVEKREEEENLLHKTNKKAFTALNWLYKQETGKNKLNYFLEMQESLGVKEVKRIRKRSSTLSRDLSLTIGNQIKI